VVALVSCFTSGHRPRLAPDGLRCRDCERRTLTRSEVPPAVTLMQVLAVCAIAGALWAGCA